MSYTYLRDNNGKIIGKVDIQSNGNKTLFDNNGKILGRYYASTNQTRDNNGYIVGYCDVLLTLLR